MRNIAIALFLIPLLLSPAAALAGTVYGKGVTLEQTTLISDILAKPQDYAGKPVKVKGLIVDVCAARGCWMELSSDKSYEKLRVKVEDGVMVFPLSARGKQAVVQGTVQTVRMCPDEALKFRQKEAKEKGVPFTSSMVTGIESAITILPSGAVIE